jgi:catechol-2,3-dioxygenase
VLAFQDPDGNGWELCVPRASTTQGTAEPRVLRYVSLEVTDLAQAEEFYTGVLGLAAEARLPDLLLLAAGPSERLVLLRKVERMSPRTNLMKGPHVAFEVDTATFDAAFSSLPRREQYWERETNRLPWHEPWQRAGYFYDPFFNRLALVAP